MDDTQTGIGVIGCGGFGLFALQQFVQVPGVRLVAMAGTFREAAKAAAKRFGIPAPMEIDAMLGMDGIDLVYIATPPFLHYEQVTAALEAGRHVIVEKPLATRVDHGEEMVATARRKNLLLVADLMQRYNPMFSRVRDLIGSGVLGEPLHGYFENYASDEGLSPDHWFWDREKSGGIFIEHGVHFFNLFEGWLGRGTVEAAQVVTRPGASLEEQAHCTARYPGDVLVDFYHGFHQPGRLDRQELKIVFERGDLTLYDWVPTRARIHALLDEEGSRRIMDVFPGARLDVTEGYTGAGRAYQGRHKKGDALQLVEISFGDGAEKLHIYGDLLRALMQDQLSWIADRNHTREVMEEDGLTSLAMAVEADRLAHR